MKICPRSISCSFISTVLFIFLSSFQVSYAQSGSSDLELCPEGFDQGLVTTGFVDCNRQSSQRDEREDAEIDRLDREAVCLANPNSQIQTSEIVVASNGRFFSRITCRVTRNIEPGTVLCPDDTVESIRAFDTLVCEYFGSASNTAAGAQAMLQEQTTACQAVAGGRVLIGDVLMETSEANRGDGIDFFRTSLACGIEIAPLDVFDCPFGFDEKSGSSETMLVCDFEQRDIETLAEAQSIQSQYEQICTSTTADLGMVNNSQVFASTSGSGFIVELDCDISIPRYGNFVDSETLRACDASCTETVTQSRACLNGGIIGGPGCTLPATQTIDRACNTGFDLESACPVKGIPSANIVPLLLLDDD